MKGYLIDPLERTVREIHYDGDMDTVCRLIGEDFFDTCAINDAGDAVYVGEFSQSKEDISQFKIEGVPQRFCGRAVVLGVDEDGMTSEPSISISDLRAKVTAYPDVKALMKRNMDMSGP